MWGKYVGRCSLCGTEWEFEGYEVILEPYPHGECPNPSCRLNWVAVF